MSFTPGEVAFVTLKFLVSIHFCMVCRALSNRIFSKMYAGQWYSHVCFITL